MTAVEGDACHSSSSGLYAAPILQPPSAIRLTCPAPIPQHHVISLLRTNSQGRNGLHPGRSRVLGPPGDTASTRPQTVRTRQVCPLRKTCLPSTLLRRARAVQRRTASQDARLRSIRIPGKRLAPPNTAHPGIQASHAMHQHMQASHAHSAHKLFKVLMCVSRCEL